MSTHPQPPVVRVLLALVCACGPTAVSAAATDPTLPLPEEWASALICGCEEAANFTAGRTPTRARFEFSAYELSTTDRVRVAGKSLRWHFCAASGEQTWARVAWRRSVAEPLDAISVHVKNPNAHPLNLHLEMLDADGVWYLSPPQSLGEERNWRQLSFRLADFATAPGDADPRPGVDFPVIWIAAVVEPLPAGKPCTLHLDELRAHRAPTRTAEVRELDAPSALGPGEAVAARATIVFEQAPTSRDRIRVGLMSGGAPMAQAELVFDTAPEALAPGTPHIGRARGLKVPGWLPPGGAVAVGSDRLRAPGRYALQLSSPTLRLTGPGKKLRALAIAGARREMPTATIDSGSSPPRIKLGNEALLPLMGSLSGGSSVGQASSLPAGWKPAPRRLAEAGARILGLPATTDYHPFGWANDAWPAPDAPDFSGLDRRAAQALDAFPEALLLLEVHIGSAPWWDAEHPEQMQGFGDGALAPPRMWGRKRTYADLTSARWAEGARARLHSLVEHVEAAAYGHRVIGYELMAGDLGAWRPWGAELGLGSETSEVRQEAFRARLRRRYESVDALRAAWGGPNRLVPLPEVSTEMGFATWDEVTIPVPAQQPGHQEPLLYDPAADAALVDLAHFRAEAPVDLALRMAATAKEACEGRKLVGVCYGHLLAQAAAPESWRWPHLALSRLLGDRHVDFLTGPLWSAAQTPGPSFPAASARANGKLYLERLPAGASGQEVARSAAFALASGAGIIVGASACEHVKWLPGALERLVNRADDNQQTAAQLAVIVDDVSARYLSQSGGLATALFATQMDYLTGSGLPCRFLMLNDLIEERLPPAQMCLFLDAFKVEGEPRTALKRQVCGDKRTAVWVYAPGAIGNMISGRTMKDLTGIRLTVVTQPGPLQVSLGTGSPLLGGELTAGFSYGVTRAAPRFYGVADAGQRLGDLMGTDFRRRQGNAGQVGGLVAREFDDWTSVFSAAPALPPELLRALARRAGVPVYVADGPASAGWLGEGVIALQGTAAGSRTLQLPAPATVTDLLTGQTLASDQREVTVKLGEGDTGLYAVAYQ